MKKDKMPQKGEGLRRFSKVFLSGAPPLGAALFYFLSSVSENKVFDQSSVLLIFVVLFSLIALVLYMISHQKEVKLKVILAHIIAYFILLLWAVFRIGMS